MTRTPFTDLLQSIIDPIIADGAAHGRSPQTAIQRVTGDHRSLASMRKKAAALDRFAERLAAQDSAK